MRDYLQFLTALSQNNHKEWMDSNRPWYESARKYFLKDVEFLLFSLTEIDPRLAAIKPKDCVFRQHRDIRFSANKDPYKTNFAAYFSPKGKKSEGPGWYIHLQPGNSFFAGGIWMPMSETLKKIRKEIDYSGHELETIIQDSKFAEAFPNIEGEKLKTNPRGYPTDHPQIELLRMKSFIVSKKISDQEILSGDFLKIAVDGFALMMPFLSFLERAIEDVEDGSDII